MRDVRADTRLDLLSSIRQLSDDELVARVKSLAARERRATALLVAHLAELDARDVHLRAGYSSPFAYCRNALALSEHEAYNRIEVARAARVVPARSPRFRPIATGYSSPSAARRSRSCVSPETCCGTRSPRATMPPFSTAP